MKIDDVITKAQYESMKDLSYEQFSEYLTKLVKLCVEESLRALPAVVKHLAGQADYLKTLSEEFYKENKDLVSHKKTMANVMMEVEAKNPGMDYDEVLKISAEKSRDIISKMKDVKVSKGIDLGKFDSKLGKL